MAESARIRVGFIGVGVMARVHLGDMLRSRHRGRRGLRAGRRPPMPRRPSCSTSTALAVPPNEPDWRGSSRPTPSQLDAVVIITPHVLHFAQATACLEAGLDVLLEKPMVMTADEATGADRDARPDRPAARRRLPGQPVAAGPRGRRDASDPASSGRSSTSTRSPGRTGRRSPKARGASSPRFPAAASCSTPAPTCSTPSSDLAGEDFAEVAAWLEDDGRPVDIRAVVMGRLASGALVTMNACGRAIPSCHSDIRVFTSKAILRTGIWGEGLEIQRAGPAGLRKVRSVAPMSVWEQFLDVRAGRDAQPEPTRGRPADGAPVGRDPRVDGARRRGRHASGAAAPRSERRRGLSA